jgi:hypothetical protein
MVTTSTLRYLTALEVRGPTTSGSGPAA